MQPKIKLLKEKKLIGKRLVMSLANDLTPELWKSFMVRHKEITGKLTNDFICAQIYDSKYFEAFNPSNKFEKLAMIEVAGFEHIPSDMETFTLIQGFYAVFEYKGSDLDDRIYEYIFTSWLPSSNFQLDDRPHFQILGKNYKPNDPESEEEIWIPVIQKT